MEWLSESPLIILISILLVSFLESFALLGILVPGVVLLFSLAALANALAIPMLHVLFFAAVGAMLGDFSSYFLGRHLQHRISHISWFRRHQNWLDQGEWFIQKWGWLSVIIGRFLGPLRPIIPIVSGTLGMPTKVFVPLSTLTVFAWAPAYMLPGYFTGELTDLWRLQPLSTRSLIIYSLTAISVSAGSLAIYHHAHPERWRLKGWITQQQADRWPIASLMLSATSGFALLLLHLFPPTKHNAMFLAWSETWRNSWLDPFWEVVIRLTHADLVGTTFAVSALWLILGGRISLAYLASLVFSGMILCSGWLSDHGLLIAPGIQGDYFSDLLLFVFTTGFLANIVSSRVHSLSRWPIYLFTSQIIILAALSHVWEGTLTLSLAGQALFSALLVNGLLRAAWQQLHLPLRLCNAVPLLVLLGLTSLAYASLGLI